MYSCAAGDAGKYDDGCIQQANYLPNMLRIGLIWQKKHALVDEPGLIIIIGTKMTPLALVYYLQSLVSLI